MSLRQTRAADRALLEALAERLGGSLDRDFGGELRLDGLKASIAVRLERVLPTDKNAEHRRAALAALTASAEQGATDFHCRQSVKRRGFLSSSVCSKNISIALVRRNNYRPAENGEFEYVFVCGTHKVVHGGSAVACVPLAADDLRRIRELGRRRDQQRRHAERLLVREPDRLTCQMLGCEEPTDHVQMADVASRFAGPSAEERAQLDAACNFYCKNHHAAETARDLTIVFQFSKWELEDVRKEAARAAEANRKAQFARGLKAVP